MIEAQTFVEAARSRSFRFYAGVPCSFLGPLINCVLDSPGLRYVSSANEGDAVASAAGAMLGGARAVALMQNSGLGNAVSPLTSLTWVFRIPVLLVVSLRGDPEGKDEPQHALMGEITTRMLDVLEIPWDYFPRDPGEIGPALDRACEFMDREERPYALVVRRASLAPHALGARGSQRMPRRDACTYIPHRELPLESRPTRRQVLERILAVTPEPDSVVVATTGYTGRELYALQDRANQLYVVGSMGCASSLALGLSLVRPELRTVIVDGDGAALMRMGNLATLGAYGGDNLVHVLLDNEMHESTGGQRTVSGTVSFGGIARSCGYGLVAEGDEPELLDAAFAERGTVGPRFAHVRIRSADSSDLPRPSLSPTEVRARLVRHLSRRPEAKAQSPRELHV